MRNTLCSSITISPGRWTDVYKRQAVYPTHCRWHQNGEPYRLEHADLMGAWELPDGFVLQWEGPPLFAVSYTHLIRFSYPEKTMLGAEEIDTIGFSVLPF